MSPKRTAIGRTFFKVVVVAIALAVLVLPVASRGVQTTQAADGMSAQTLASALSVEPGGQLVVMRIVIEPGASFPDHHHPGIASYTVISGALQTTLIQGGAAIDRNGVEFEAKIGATMNLTAGQSISYSPHAVKTLANRTSKPLVLLVSLLLDPDEPLVASDDWTSVFQYDLN